MEKIYRYSDENFKKIYKRKLIVILLPLLIICIHFVSVYINLNLFNIDMLFFKIILIGFCVSLFISILQPFMKISYKVAAKLCTLYISENEIQYLQLASQMPGSGATFHFYKIVNITDVIEDKASIILTGQIERTTHYGNAPAVGRANITHAIGKPTVTSKVKISKVLEDTEEIVEILIKRKV